jgi:hypothetical protein
MPCQKIMALVRSTEKSVLDPTVKMAEGTYKLVTPNVECVLSSDDPHLASRKYSLTATCNMINVSAFRLDPLTRGKPQHALITITAMDGDSFVVETVQLLSIEAAAHAKDSLKKLQFLAMHIHVREKKPPSRLDGGGFPSSGKETPHPRTQWHGRCHPASSILTATSGAEKTSHSLAFH